MSWEACIAALLVADVVLAVRFRYRYTKWRAESPEWRRMGREWATLGCQARSEWCHAWADWLAHEWWQALFADRPPLQPPAVTLPSGTEV